VWCIGRDLSSDAWKRRRNEVIVVRATLNRNDTEWASSTLYQASMMDSAAHEGTDPEEAPPWRCLSNKKFALTISPGAAEDDGVSGEHD
jgi:hypothetical protein